MLGGEGLQPGLQPFLRAFKLLYQPAIGTIGVLAFDHLQLVKLFLEEPLLRVLGERDALEARVCDDDGVPIPGGDAAEELLSILGLKILFARNQDIRARIQRQQFGRELAKHVIGDDKQRLAGEAKPLQLHRGGDHRIGFTRADYVGEQGVRRLQDAPDAGLLVSVELDRSAGARQCQMIAIKSADARVIERVVVKAAKPFSPGIIRPYPFLEPFLDALLLLTSRLGRLCVDCGFFVHDVVHGGRFEVQRVLDEFEAGVAVGAPIGRVGGCPLRLPIGVDVPGAECVDVPNVHAGWNVQQFMGELLYVLRRQPGRAEPHVNFRGGEVRRLHRLQRLDVFKKTRVGNGRRVRNGELLADIAGEILVVGFPLVRLRIQEDESLAVGQKLLQRFIEQASHVVEVNAAALVQRNEQRFLGRGDGLDGLPVMNGALVEDGGLGCAFGLVVVTLQ